MGDVREELASTLKAHGVFLHCVDLGNGETAEYVRASDFVRVVNALSARAAVPEGFVMVPIKPSSEMREAGRRSLDSAWSRPSDVWSAMLAAAPQPAGHLCRFCGRDPAKGCGDESLAANTGSQPRCLRDEAPKPAGEANPLTAGELREVIARLREVETLLRNPVGRMVGGEVHDLYEMGKACGRMADGLAAKSVPPSPAGRGPAGEACPHDAWKEIGGWRKCETCGHGWSAGADPQRPAGEARIPKPDGDGHCDVCGLAWPNATETEEAHACPPGFANVVRPAPSAPADVEVLAMFVEWAESSALRVFAARDGGHQWLVDTGGLRKLVRRLSGAQQAEESPNRYGTSSGHGHVWPRPDGLKARCGGPNLCATCKRDLLHACGHVANAQQAAKDGAE